MRIGIIGGSGLYEMEGLEDPRTLEVSTPFGDPSTSFVIGTLDGVDVVFLARHGAGHTILPSEINHRANIFAMKKIGVERVLSISAVGSFREQLAPQDLVLVDQYVDRTKASDRQTFFGNGIVAHIAFGEPVCAQLREAVFHAAGPVLAARANGINNRPPRVHAQGTYLNMEGPAFSTRAESYLYKSWGMDVIGMTGLAEAKLAREAEMCFCSLAFVTDYDCWHGVHEDVTVQMVMDILHRNANAAKEIIRRAVPVIGEDGARTCDCNESLANAILTHSSAVPAETKQKLNPILGHRLQ